MTGAQHRACPTCGARNRLELDYCLLCDAGLLDGLPTPTAPVSADTSASSAPVVRTSMPSPTPAPYPSFAAALGRDGASPPLGGSRTYVESGSDLDLRT